MKGVQCYELFGGIALKNRAFFTFVSMRPYFSDCGAICNHLLINNVPVGSMVSALAM